MYFTENVTEQMYFNEESIDILYFYAYQHNSMNVLKLYSNQEIIKCFMLQTACIF